MDLQLMQVLVEAEQELLAEIPLGKMVVQVDLEYHHQLLVHL